MDEMKVNFEKDKKNFFPKVLIETKNLVPLQRLPKNHGFGGWSNPIDIEFCFFYFF